MRTTIYLDKEDYIHHGASLQPGEVVRINHDVSYCGGSSNSLKIWKDEYNIIKAKCYRCGRYGRYIKDRTYKKILRKVKEGSHTLPKDLTTIIKEWPPVARIWIHNARITQEEVQENGIGYSPSLSRVVLPVWHSGVLSGYEARRVFPADKYPKYISYINQKDNMWILTPNGNPCVLVEDRLSAIRIARITSSMYLRGTELHDSMLSSLLNFSSILIYLDNDNAIVKRKEVQIMRTLSLFHPNIKIIRSSGVDPKSLSHEDLKEVIRNVCLF